MMDMIEHLSTLTYEQRLLIAVQYGTCLLVTLALLWKSGRGSVQALAWLFRPGPLSPLGEAILKALDAPDAILPAGNAVEAGGVRVLCIGTTFEANCEPRSIQTGALCVDVSDLLSARERTRIGKAASATHRRVSAAEKAARAVCALERIASTPPRL